MTVHSDIQGALGFPDILFSTLSTRYQVHNILRSTIGDTMGPLPPETLLASMDVTSLYTNIPHEDGIKACEEVWETRTVKDPPTQIQIKLLTLVLKCNNFEFNGKHYLQIPHEDGIKACEEVWKTRTVKDPPTQIQIKLLTLVLKCNNFEFNGKHYLQIQGTAMGTKMATSYANIFMGRLEKTAATVSKPETIFMAQVYR